MAKKNLEVGNAIKHSVLVVNIAVRLEFDSLWNLFSLLILLLIGHNLFRLMQIFGLSQPLCVIRFQR